MCHAFSRTTDIHTRSPLEVARDRFTGTHGRSGRYIFLSPRDVEKYTFRFYCDHKLFPVERPGRHIYTYFQRKRVTAVENRPNDPTAAGHRSRPGPLPHDPPQTRRQPLMGIRHPEVRRASPSVFCHNIQ